MGGQGCSGALPGHAESDISVGGDVKEAVGYSSLESMDGTWARDMNLKEFINLST